jgi:hypothetical protein
MCCAELWGKHVQDTGAEKGTGMARGNNVCIDSDHDATASMLAKVSGNPKSKSPLTAANAQPYSDSGNADNASDSERAPVSPPGARELAAAAPAGSPLATAAPAGSPLATAEVTSSPGKGKGAASPGRGKRTSGGSSGEPAGDASSPGQGAASQRRRGRSSGESSGEATQGNQE